LENPQPFELPQAFRVLSIGAALTGAPIAIAKTTAPRPHNLLIAHSFSQAMAQNDNYTEYGQQGRSYEVG
jgi:hypothetical protein